MSEEIKIILADDHPLMRKGLKDIIEEQVAWKIVGEAGDGKQTLELIKKLNAHLIIMDIDMPEPTGLQITQKIQEWKIPIDIIVLTMYDKETIFYRAMDYGVKGYVIKDSVITEIVDAIKSVLDGKYYISPSLSGYLVKRGKYNSMEGDNTGTSLLTTTERRILKMISKNLTTKDIANELFISVRTVETHRSNICQKLKLHGTNALLRFALENRDMI